jgi:hypothetical protein
MFRLFCFLLVVTGMVTHVGVRVVSATNNATAWSATIADREEALRAWSIGPDTRPTFDVCERFMQPRNLRWPGSKAKFCACAMTAGGSELKIGQSAVVVSYLREITYQHTHKHPPLEAIIPDDAMTGLRSTAAAAIKAGVNTCFDQASDWYQDRQAGQAPR